MSIGYEAIEQFNAKQGLSYGIEFNTINTDHQYNDGSDVFSYESNTSWLTAPVLYRHTALEKVTLLGGGYIASAVNRKLKAGSVSADADNIIKSLDYGLIVGVECAFSKQIFADVQYRLGLADLNKLGTTEDLKTSQLRLSVGYAF